MFLVPVVAAVVGALAMGSTKPRTAFRKTAAMGARSGILYEVEDFEGAGFVVIRAPDGSTGVVTRKDRGGFEWSRGRGHPRTLKVLREDFGVGEDSTLPAGKASP